MEEIRTMQATASLQNARAAEQQYLEGAKVGEAEVAIAAYNIRDTKRPHGVRTQQILDFGCFRSFCDSRDFKVRSVPLYLDHGDAIKNNGLVDSRLKLGKGVNFEERDNVELRSGGEPIEALVADARWNLEKQVARESFSDLIFDPEGETFSFRWDDDETYRKDGEEHVSNIPELTEFSQVGVFGAQRETGALVDSIRSRSAAVQSHTTGFVDVDWDGEKQAKALTNTGNELAFRMMHGYADPEGDPEEKATYRFAHHMVEDGSVGKANVKACLAVIDELNSARSMSGMDRRSVYRHVAEHLHEADHAVPELKAPIPSKDELMAWANDPAFRKAVVELLNLGKETEEFPASEDELVERAGADEAFAARMQDLITNATAKPKDSTYIKDGLGAIWSMRD